MPKLHFVRLRNTWSLVVTASLAALLSGCGSPAEPASNAATLPDDMTNAINVAENVAVNEAGPVNVANETAAPAAKAEPTPAASASPTPEAKPVEAASAGDAANGAKLFAQCKICHSVEPDKNGLGPSLHDVVGRKAATLPGFAYSAAMKDSGLVWTDPTLDDYLRAPMKKVPGTKMAFAGVANDKNRADIIAYLDTLK